MKRFIAYSSIEQFRTVIKKVQNSSRYIGQDENDEPIYDRNVQMPTLRAIGSEKIHGTNASVCYSHSDGFWVQSRKNIISQEQDNASCALSAMQNEEAWMEIITTLAKEYDIDLNEKIIVIYFEWAGGNIQKSSALSGLSKRAMIFQYFKVSPLEPTISDDGSEINAYWLATKSKDVWMEKSQNDIFNIMNFPTVTIEIDFNQPLMSQNKMIAFVDSLELSSLVGEQFGIEKNIGEGYVFSFEFKGDVHKFKVKGEEHSKHSGKVKTLKPVDEAFENKKIEFVNNIACISWRLEQMYNEVVSEQKDDISIKDLGGFLRKVINDVMKEESDIMEEQGLEPKMVNSMISKVAKSYFFSRLDEV